jgi:IS1 family transposase
LWSENEGIVVVPQIEVVEMDEMHSYVGSKKACWLWIAVDRLGHRFLNVIVGSRDTDTGQCLWEGVTHHDIGRIMTDYWKPYQKPKPSPLKVTTAYSGIFWLGYAVSRNVTLSV